MVALAPVTRLDNTKSALFLFISNNLIGIIEFVSNLIGLWSVLGEPLNAASKVFCGLNPEFCLVGEEFLITQDSSLDDRERFGVYMAHVPAGVSIHSLEHFG